MGATPDQLRHETEETRAHLAENVDRLARKVSPKQAARRRTDRTRRRLHSARERVMGTAHESGQSMAQTAHSGKERVQEAAQQAPDEVLEGTRGNPLAAGLIAFGAGLLAGSVLPASGAEEKVGRQVRDHSDELVEPVKQIAQESAQEIREGMREPVSQAAESVKGTAQDAAKTTREQGRTSGR